MESKQNIKTIAAILTFVPLVYIVLLAFIEGIVPMSHPQPDTLLEIWIPVILAVVSLFDAELAFQLFFKNAIKATTKEPNEKNFAKARSNAIIGFVLIESVAMYGFLIGIIQLFVTQTFNMTIPLTFMTISFLLSLYAYLTYVPKLSEFIQNRQIE